MEINLVSRCIILFLLVSSFCLGKVEFYSSGLLKNYESEKPYVIEEVSDFLNRYFNKEHFEWRIYHIITDHTHIHYWFKLYYKNYPVSEHILKVHYNRNGWVDFASSNWRSLFSKPLYFNKKVLNSLINRYNHKRNFRDLDKVLWISPFGKAYESYEFIQCSILEECSKYYFDARTGKVLAKKSLIRNYDAPQKVYLVNPDRDTFKDVTLSDLDLDERLSNSFLHIMRYQDSDTLGALSDIDPKIIYANNAEVSNASNDPSTYNYTCTGDTSECSNQAFDGVNTYYHITEFRKWLLNYYNELGISEDVFNKKALVDIIVNYYEDNRFNNAFYYEKSCRNGNEPKTESVRVGDACIIFLPPAQTEKYGWFHPLAREAIIITHEYQHYITDVLVGIIPSENDKPKVGDALHEGFSDYFAVSYVSKKNGTDITKVGEYGFKNNPDIQRDISILREYKSDKTIGDHYSVGLTWSSGLWSLRNSIGKNEVDKLVIKAMLFLGSEPDYIEAIEALVKADKMLYSGAHTYTIRELFYDTLKFSGGKTIKFRDRELGIYEVGIRGCGSIKNTTQNTNGMFLLILILVIGSWKIWFQKKSQF